MSEHLRALIVIIGLAIVVFVIAKGPACAGAMNAADFDRRRNLWFAITLIAFLAHNFWIYVFFTTILLLVTVSRESNKLAMFFFLVFALPAVAAQIPGPGGINQLFSVHYYRILALTVLFPAFLYLWFKKDSEGFGRSLPDKLFAAYLILQLLLIMQFNSLTNALRHGVFYAFTDAFLPYYVASRSLKNIGEFRDALMAYVAGAFVISAIGAFEAAKGWLLYGALEDALGVPWNLGSYLSRDDTLRALATAGHPLALGYVLAIAIGYFLYLRKSATNPLAWGVGMTLLTVGLLSTLSRGPVMGALAIVLAFLATGTAFVSRAARLGFYVIITFTVMMATPASEIIIDYLGYFATVDTYNITYRVRLLMTSIDVIRQSPLFGAYDFYLIPEFQDLKQGQGIIDIVNTYVGIGLASGVTGLSLFCGFFIVVGTRLKNALRSLPDHDSEHYILGRALLATLLGMLVLIFTVSNIVVVPIIYWTVGGLCVAYLRMIALAAPAPQTPVPVKSSRLRTAATTNT